MSTIDIKQLKKLCANYKLLYVEDDNVARETSLELFSNFFDFIDIAKDGSDGLKQFNAKDYDLIITDIKMPKLDGIEMFRAIRETNKEIPVLFLSAHNESSFFVEAIKLGVNGYLLKPLNIEQFKFQIAKTIEEIKLKKEAKNYKIKLEKEVFERTIALDKKLHYDEVTGLLNRYSLFEKIATFKNPVLLVIDIDRFKIINEFYGDNIGTFVLKEFAKFLTDYVRQTHFNIFRLSADKFILLENNPRLDPLYYETFTEKLLNAISLIKINNHTEDIYIDVSIGISFETTHTLETAEIALNHAKKHKKHFMVYNNLINNTTDIQESLKYKALIKKAIHSNGVVPVYQAIVDRYQNIKKHEILMRIKDDNQKLITPFYFLDTAIKTRLYKDLSSIIVFSALKKLTEINQSLSINFDYADINNDKFINKIANFISKHKHIGSRAIFEITETQSMEDYKKVKKFIKRFRQYGVKFAIDDFGSGFSNFEYILEIEPDYLKIDGSLIKNIDTNKKSYILVKAIVQFSHELGIKVIAEYVYNKTIFTMLKDIGVDEFQGYYFSVPDETLL